MDSLNAPVSLTHDSRITATVAAELPRLRAFVRRRVADLAEVDDIVQDTFEEFVAADRLMQPIGQVAGWLARVARNRIIDRFRRRQRDPLSLGGHGAGRAPAEDDGAADLLGDALAPAGDPESALLDGALALALEDAIASLPAAQREVFLAHELEGESFRTMAERTGVPVNTLLGRKHAAVLALRGRLKEIHDEWNE